MRLILPSVEASRTCHEEAPLICATLAAHWLPRIDLSFFAKFLFQIELYPHLPSSCFDQTFTADNGVLALISTPRVPKKEFRPLWMDSILATAEVCGPASRCLYQTIFVQVSCGGDEKEKKSHMKQVSVFCGP